VFDGVIDDDADAFDSIMASDPEADGDAGHRWWGYSPRVDWGWRGGTIFGDHEVCIYNQTIRKVVKMVCRLVFNFVLHGG